MKELSNSAKNIQFTVFTPTFNRADKIHRVYQSLSSQTYREFEWIIIDDGSTDNTKEIITPWLKNSDFPITYIYQENSGKHFAFNKAVSLAKGALFLTADDDDEFYPESLQVFIDTWNSIEDKETFSGVTALCVDAKTGEIVGDKFPSDVFDSHTLESQYIYKIDGEKWGFQRTDILKEFPFPQIAGEKYFPENFVWTQIARKYKTRYINVVLRRYYQHEGGGLIATRINHPHVLTEWYLYDLNHNFDYLVQNLYRMIGTVINVGRMGYHSKSTFTSLLARVDGYLKKLIFISGYPGALLFVLLDKVRHKV